MLKRRGFRISMGNCRGNLVRRHTRDRVWRGSKDPLACIPVTESLAVPIGRLRACRRWMRQRWCNVQVQPSGRCLQTRRPGWRGQLCGFVDGGGARRDSNCCTRVVVSLDCSIMEPIDVSTTVLHASRSLSLSRVVAIASWNPVNCFAMSWTPASCFAMASMVVFKSSIEVAISF